MIENEMKVREPHNQSNSEDVSPQQESAPVEAQPQAHKQHEGQERPRTPREGHHDRSRPRRPRTGKQDGQQRHHQQQPAQQHHQRQQESYAPEAIAAPAGMEHVEAQPQPQQYAQHRHNNPQDNRHRDRDRDGFQGHSQQQAPRVLEELSLTELQAQARKLGIVSAGLMNKEKLIETIKHVEAHPELELEVEGVLEKLPDGFGFLRSARYDYVSGPDDVYVSPSQIRRFGLRTGDTVTGVIRKPKEGEKYFALLKVNQVNHADPASMHDRPHFDRLTPLHPNRKFTLEYDPTMIATRIMDLFTPVGKGQRGLIVAPPKVGKTLLLKEITQSLVAGHPEAHLIVLLVDERPEEVADMKRAVKGTSAEVISSTFDESAIRHVQVAEIVLEKAKRLVESGRDVIILLDSMTRLARAYNTNAPASGKVLTGGIDAHALQWPKRFFGAARCMEEGGSLTILATALVDTGSRMDEVIYEEFKGTGNMEMHMTRKLSNRRTYPAFDLLMSGTRRDDLLQTEEDLNKVWVVQKFLAAMNTIEGMEFLIDKMKKLKTNREFLESINKK
jgi:transcription termination factor Rho